MPPETPRPLDVRPFFPPLRESLTALLDGLDGEDWNRPVTSAWRVRDVVAHLLDTDLRRLAVERDGHFPPPPTGPIDSFDDLVGFLDQLNATWVTAAKRLSPRMLVELLAWSGPRVEATFADQDLHADATFGVAWAGQERSPVWFDIARELTEKWHHQQQIRDAVGAPPIDDAEILGAVLDTFVRGLPWAYRSAGVPVGTRIGLILEGQVSRAWVLEPRDLEWALIIGTGSDATDASITLPSDVAWKLFSGRMTGDAARVDARTEGPNELVDPVFAYVAFMVNQPPPAAPGTP
ncbi:MAG: maleylpyruvate isomerase N-terminal domain-containing protein [Acidobacteriota bacterium]